jgi:hypothetical protein
MFHSDAPKLYPTHHQMRRIAKLTQAFGLAAGKRLGIVRPSGENGYSFIAISDEKGS